MKLYNIVLGLMNHNSKHPCYICKTYKNPDGTWAIADKRTLKNLLEDHELWKESNESRAFLKNYNNVQNPPLFKGENLQNKPLFAILPIPGLHCIKLGGVNLLFKHLGEAVKLESFLKKHGLIMEGYHGGQYIGPDWGKLDDLEEEVKTQDPSKVVFIDAMRDLKEVYRIAHTKDVDPNHREIVKKFENSVMILHKEYKVPITPKLHIIIDHLPEFFDYTGKTLRKRTDQTVESTHSKFDKFVKIHNYQVRDVKSDKVGENLLKAVKHFNSYNL